MSKKSYKTRKRILGLIVGFCLLITGFTPTTIMAYSAHTQSEAVAWAQSQLGKALDYDGKYGAQCVDLICYYYQYLGTTSPGGNAEEYRRNNLPSGWTRVYENYQPGDIAVWKPSYRYGSYSTTENGHVGIVTSADSVGFNAVGQNVGNNKFCTQNWFPLQLLECAIRPDFGATSSAAISYSNIRTNWTDTWNAEIAGDIQNPITRLPYPFDYEEQYSGVMDKNGNIMMSPEYSNISNIGDSGYYVACEAETGMYGIIDENYEWICESEYSGIYKVWNGSTDNLVKVNEEYLLIAVYDFQEGHGAEIINEYGGTIVPMEYYDINAQCGMNRLIVENSEGYYGAIDLNGNLEIACQYDELGDFSYDEETYAMKDGAVFAVDIYGNERFLTNADDCWQIDSNLYEVGINENWSVIDSNGEYLFSETYDNHEVNEKYIAGSNEENKNGILMLKSGEVVSTEYQKYMLSYKVPDIVKIYDGANYGMLGSNGELIVSCSYDSCEISEDGVYITADRQRDEYGNYTECTLFDSNGNEIRTFDTGIYNVGTFQKILNAA